MVDLLMLTAFQHDAVLDYYGRRLATCSSDKTIKIFEIDGESHRLTETLKGWANMSTFPCKIIVNIGVGMRAQCGVSHG